MADDNFRSYPGRDSSARDAARVEGEADDPLAELARLIGQTDPHAEERRPDVYQSEQSAAPEADRDWAAAEEGYVEEYERTEDRYAPQQQRSYNNEPPGPHRYYAEPSSQYEGFREETDDDYFSRQMPVSRAEQLPAYPTAATRSDFDADEHAGDDGEAYAAAEEYYDEPRPRRRSGVIAIMAVFAVAVVGSAAAFGYHAMFGGSVLPTLPPIIKAGNSPNKIMPNSGDAQASNPGQTGVASASASENLISREEEPVNTEPRRAVPRVVSTIPITSGQPAAAASPAQPSASPWPNPPTPGSPWPNPTATMGTTPSGTPSAAASAQVAPQAQGSAEPKWVRTVVIRSDQPGAPDAAPIAQPAQAQSPPPPTAARPVAAPPKQTAAASASPTGPNAPLSLVPAGQREAAAPPPARVQTAEASAGPANAPAAASPSGGGYAVQVTSQRSEAEAQSSFRELRAKFPNQLGGREPIIRRADLGTKGTYYRALVGPFASMEEAAGMCSGLKAAGGNCLVQRN